MKSFVRIAGLAYIAAALISLATSVRAQESYPSRPVRIICAYVAGGGGDIRDGRCVNELDALGRGRGRVHCQQTEHRNRGEEATGAAHLKVAVRPHDGWGRTAKLVYAFQLMLYRLSYPLTVNFTSRVMVFFPALSVILMARRY